MSTRQPFFHRKLKAHVFQQSYPDIILYLSYLFATVVLEVSYLGHSK